MLAVVGVLSVSGAITALTRLSDEFEPARKNPAAPPANEDASTETAGIVTSVPAEPLCAAVADALYVATHLDGSSADALAAGLRDLSDDLSSALDLATDEVAAEIAWLHDLAGRSFLTFEAMSRLVPNADDRTRRAAAGVTATAPDFFAAVALIDAPPIGMPALTEQCPVVTPTDVDPNLGEGMVDFQLATTTFVETEMGTRAEFAMLQDVAAGYSEALERSDAGSVSGRDADYRRCDASRDADEFGDDAGCDRLQSACLAGDFLACNDLFWSSPEGSRYEQTGASCGGLADFGDPPYAGFCERLGD